MELASPRETAEKPARHEPKSELARRSIVKTVSWRTIASLDTLLLSFLVVSLVAPRDTAGAAKAAGILAAIEVPNKLILYYFHERIWARITWGRRKEPEYSI